MAQTLENRTSRGWSPLAMPQRQPKHVWQPPAGQPAPRPRGFLADMPRTAPSAGNARARRARRNGWNRTA